MKNTELRGTQYWRRVIVIPTAFALAASVVVPTAAPQLAPQASAAYTGPGMTSSGYASSKNGTYVDSGLFFYGAQTVGSYWDLTFRNWDSVSSHSGYVGAITVWPDDNVKITKESLSGSRVERRNWRSYYAEPVGPANVIDNGDGSFTFVFTPQTGFYDLSLQIPKAPNSNLVNEREVISNSTVYFKKISAASEFKTDADLNDPQGQNIEVALNGIVNANDGISNLGSLTDVATVAFETKPDTSVAGTKDATIIVTYKDGTKDRVNIKVIVGQEADEHNPSAKPISVPLYGTPVAASGIGNASELPQGTRFEFANGTPSTNSPVTNRPVQIKVIYSDGSVDLVDTTLTVVDDRDASQYNPSGLSKTIYWGEALPSAEDFVNKQGLPSGVTYTLMTRLDNENTVPQSVQVEAKYSDGSVDTVYASLTVLPLKDKYSPEGIDQTIEYGGAIPAGGAFVNKTGLPSDTQYNLLSQLSNTFTSPQTATIEVVYADGSKDYIYPKLTVKDGRTVADKNTPEGQDFSVNLDQTPNPYSGISNFGQLPWGTTVSIKGDVDTSVAGKFPVTLIVKYSDGSTDEVPVYLTVVDNRQDSEKYDPKSEGLTVDQDSTMPDARAAIVNAGTLPSDATYEWIIPVDTSTSGSKTGFVKVTYRDGSSDYVSVPVTVNPPVDKSTLADKNTPIGGSVTVDKGQRPDPEKAILNLDDLTSVKTVEWKTEPDTSEWGVQTAVVVVTYTDGSSDDVLVSVVVNPKDADQYDIAVRPIEVPRGGTVKAENVVINLGELPEGPTVKWESTIVTTELGPQIGTIVVTYPDGSSEKKTVTIVVVENNAGKYEPVIKENIEIIKGGTISIQEIITNISELPGGTQIVWVDKIDTSKVGGQTGTIIVKYPDGSSETKDIKVTIREWDSESYKPEIQIIEINPGQPLDPKDFIINIDDLPEGTTIGWKPGATIINTGEPGTQTGTIVVTYPDGTSKEFEVTVEIKEPTVTPEPSEEPSTPAEPSEEPVPSEEPSEEPSTPAEPSEEPVPSEEPSEEPSTPVEPSEEPVPSEEPSEEPSTPAEPSEEPVPSEEPTPEQPSEEPTTPAEPSEDPTPTPEPGHIGEIKEEGTLEGGSIVIGKPGDLTGDIEITQPEEADIEYDPETGEIEIKPIDGSGSGSISFEVKDQDGNKGTIVVDYGESEKTPEVTPEETPETGSISFTDPEGKESEIKIIDGKGSIETSGEIILNKEFGELTIVDKDGNDITGEFIITKKDGKTYIVRENGSTEPFDIKVKDGDDEIVINVTVKKQDVVDPNSGSSDAEKRCAAITAGVTASPLLFLIPIGILSQVKIPGLDSMNNELGAQIRRMNDELQRGMGVANDNIRRAVSQVNASLGANSALMGQVGGVLGGVIALVALAALGTATYTACMSGSGEDMSSMFNKDEQPE